MKFKFSQPKKKETYLIAACVFGFFGAGFYAPLLIISMLFCVAILLDL